MRLILCILLNFIYLCAYSQVKVKTLNPTTAFTGVSTKGGNYAKQTKDFFVGWDNGNFGRGYLEFDLSSIPKDATITGTSIYLNSKVAGDKNFGGTLKLYRIGSIAADGNQTTWNMLKGAGIPVIDMTEKKYLPIPSEGIFQGYESDLLTTYVKELVGKRLYLAINNVEEASKIIRMSVDKDKLYLNVYYTGGTSEGGGNSSGPGVPTITVGNVGTHTITISWKNVDAREYDIALTASNQNKSIKKNEKKAKSVTFTNLAPDTYFDISVAAWGPWRELDGGYTSVSSSSRVSNILTKPLVPDPPKTVKAEFINQSWEQDRGLYISFDNTYVSNWGRDFCIYEYKYPYDGTILRKYGLNYPSASKHLISNLSPNKTYLFGVTASNIVGESNPSLVTVTTPSLPTPPTPPTTIDNSVVVPTAFTARSFAANQYVLTWSYPESAKNNITGFLIERRSSPTEAGGPTKFTLPASARSQDLGVLGYYANPSGQSTYIYSIQAFNATKASPYASTGFITKPITKSLVDNSSQLSDEVDIFVRDEKIVVNGLSNYGIKVYDMSGRILINKLDLNNENIDISAFSKGVYIVHVITKEETIVKKIIK